MAIDIIARGLAANAANKASQAVGLTGGTINGDLNINGNLTVSGASYETHIEQIYTKDDYIALRDGAISGLTDGNYTGFEAVKYDGVNNGRLVFDNTGTARVGDVGSEQPLATRDESTGMTNGGFTYWDGTTNKLKTSTITITNLSTAFIFNCQLADSSTYLSTGNSLRKILITSEYDDMILQVPVARVDTGSTSGLPTFTITNLTTGQSMLSTPLTINLNATNSLSATTPAVVDPLYKVVHTGDEIGINCTVSGTGTRGGEVIITLKN